MKVNKIDHSGRRKRIVRFTEAFLLLAALAGLFFAYTKIRNLWLEQCVITDVARQVSITDGKMVRAENIAHGFGLKEGANLALIDFTEKRAELLKKIPNIRNLTIIRHLPNRVTITVEERVPIVRMNITGIKTASNRVADADGVVFTCRRGTQTLPVLREPFAPGTPPGHPLTGHTRAALRLLEVCSEKFGELNVQEADASKPDFIVLTLGNYSTVKIAWTGMDEETSASRQHLIKQLEHLSQTISSQVGTGIRVWNATQPGKIFADPQKGIL